MHAEKKQTTVCACICRRVSAFVSQKLHGNLVIWRTEQKDDWRLRLYKPFVMKDRIPSTHRFSYLSWIYKSMRLCCIINLNLRCLLVRFTLASCELIWFVCVRLQNLSNQPGVKLLFLFLVLTTFLFFLNTSFVIDIQILDDLPITTYRSCL